MSEQRNSVGWRTNGRGSVIFIEDTSNDLEIWESPDTDWQDEAGVWTLTDDETGNNYDSVDVEPRQHYIWAIAKIAAAGNQLVTLYIDLAAGVPAWAGLTTPVWTVDNIHFSLVLDKNLLGVCHIAYVASGNIEYRYSLPTDIYGTNIIVNAGDYPQIICDGEQRLWCFYTGSNNLWAETAFDEPPHTTTWMPDGAAQIYTGTGLVSSYHATWLAMDDTIHVILVDTDVLNPNNTRLRYLRRTSNGWDAAVTLLTVDGQVVGDNDGIAWPQICVDRIGNIFVSYILEDVQGTGGDLRGFYLDAGVYSNPVVGNWSAHTNIDGSADTIIWAIMPDYIPVTAEI